MKTRCLVSLILVATFMLLSQPAIADDLDDLKATVMKMSQAVNTGDMETLFACVDDNMAKFAPEDGIPHVLNKEIKERVKQALIKWSETHTQRGMWHKPEFRVIGNTGLVWGLMEVTVVNKKSGIAQKSFLKCSQTFVKSDGKWLCVFNHQSPIPSTLTLY